MSINWKSLVLRYLLAISILVLIVGIQSLLIFFGIKLSFTIPIIVGLVAASWYGRLGPGIFLAILIAVISAYSTPPTPDTSLAQWFFAQISSFALMVFIVFVIGVLRSVTSREREASEHYRRLFQNNPFPVWIHDLETLRLLDVNHAAEKTYGYLREEFLKMTVKDIVPDEDISVLQEIEPGAEDRTIVPRLWKHRRKDGTLIDVEVTADGLLFQGRRARRILANDVTRRKKAETELRQSEERYRDLFENNPFPMWVYDAETLRFVAVNDAACRQYGYSADEFLSMNITKIRPEEDISALMENIAESSGELQKSGDWRHRRKDGSEIYVEITSHEMDFMGRNARLVLANDVTDRHKAEEEIHQLNETLERRVAERTVELESVNKELESFAYSVSHDLRAPLRAMDGFSLALVEDYGDKLDDTGKNFLTRVRTATQQMSRLIDDLLSLSRVTRAEIKRSNVDLTAIANEILTRFNEQQPRENFVPNIQDDMAVYGDERLLRIAFENLLGNAWKFTSKTENPRISFKQITENGSSIFCISDNGAGFDMKYVDKLFGAFQRLHSTNEFDGTGIGLATVQRIISRHGGRIWAESEVDKGAAFYFTI